MGSWLDEVLMRIDRIEANLIVMRANILMLLQYFDDSMNRDRGRHRGQGCL